LKAIGILGQMGLKISEKDYKNLHWKIENGLKEVTKIKKGADPDV
jgi:hypothetical protein